MSRLMTIQRMRRLLVEWQRLLRLQDWDIELNFVHHHNLSRGGFGEIDWTLEKKIATINMVYLKEVSKALEYNPEKTLVHELLHLRFSIVCRTKEGSIEDGIHEAAVDQVARALVKLRKA